MASETFNQTPGTVRDVCETVQQHPVYSHNQHALRLGVVASIVSSIAVMVLYPMPLSLQITLPVLALGGVFLVVRKHVLPRVTTTAMLDMVVFSYQLPIFLVQWMCVWLSPDPEAVGGTACMIMLSGILYVSIWSFAAASYFCAGGWILAKYLFATVPPTNEILQLLIMAPTVSLLARRSLERTMDALRESRTREQRTVETLRSALADLKNETQRRQDSELQLAHAQKHQSLGLMAAGVAHDFNNTLLAISALSDIIASTSADSGVKKSAEDVSLAVQHASGICRQMLTYAGRSSSEQKSVNLNEILKNLQPLLQATLSLRITLNVVTPTDPAFVTANEAQLQQVILNLVTNAAEATSGSGTVSVRFCEREYLTVSEFPEEVFGAPLTAGHYYLISVSDSGSGMTRDVIEQMFDPYFTTKTRGHGFGLSTVLGIVRSHQSALHVVSSPGHGTTITLLIRRGTPPEKARAIEQLRPADVHVSSPARTVLVIDDQAMVRRPLAAMLRLRGWHVIEADSGEAAVLELQRRNDFSVIIVDFLMPGMNGQETLNAIRSLGCTTPAILCSGCPAAETNDNRNLTFAGFLPKPFRKEQLESLLDTVLSQ